MLKRISAMELRKNIGQVMNEVYLKEDCFIIERSGKPKAAIVPVWILDNIQKNKEEFLEIMNRTRKYTGDLSEEEIQGEVQEAMNAVRNPEGNDD